MEKLSSALQHLVDNSPMLQLGLRQRLLNLSKAGAYLKPLLEARVDQPISVASIVMALSRLQRSFKESARRKREINFSANDLFVHSGLVVVTVANLISVRHQINLTYARIQKKGGYITVTQGVHEVTVILQAEELEGFCASLTERPINVQERVASIGLVLRKEYGTTPGFFYSVFQRLYLQNINIIEIGSTTHELVLYLNEVDVRLAFDTLYNCFVSSAALHTRR